MSVPISRPGGVTNNITGTGFGTTGTVHAMKVISGDVVSRVRSGEITGDGDATPKWNHGGLLYMQLSLQGIMVASNALSMTDIKNQNTGATASGLVNGFTFIFGTGTTNRSITVEQLFIEEFRVAWQKNAPFVSVSMNAYAMGTITDAT